MDAARIISLARETLGTPFRHQGRQAGRGLDCIGVAAYICDAAEIPYIDKSGYSREPSHGLLESGLENQPGLVSVALADMAPGDLLLMRFAGDPQHIAIHAGETIIHAFEKSGKVVEHGLTDYWRSRIVRVYRFVGVVE
jgi:cell wall-associated NlpC family hydrolase